MRADLASDQGVAAGAERGGGMPPEAGGACLLNPVQPPANLVQGAPAERLFQEPLVARVTGVRKAILVAHRKDRLAKGVDWTLERNVVAYTAVGLEKLLAALGLQAAALAWPAPGEGQHSGEVDEAAEEASDGAGEAFSAPGDGAEKSAVAPAAGADFARNVRPPVTAWPWPRATAAAVVAEQVLAIQETLPCEFVVRRLSHNPTLLQCVGEAEREVLVRVATNANFIPGMKLRARPPAKGGGIAARVYSLVGHCPRWKGRW